MRIWHQSMADLSDLPGYRDSLIEQAVHVVSPGTTLEVHGVVPGSYAGYPIGQVLGYPFTYRTVLAQAVDHALQAQREGYDAFIVGSFSDPFVSEIRSLVDIPVVSLTEASLIAASQVGQRVGAISNSAAVTRIVATRITAYGFGDRALPPVTLEPEFDGAVLSAAIADPGELISAFTLAAEDLIRCGADVLIPTEGALSQILTDAGVRAVRDVPIIDGMKAAWMMAEFVVALWSQLGIRTSRTGGYATPPAEMTAAVRAAARSTERALTQKEE